MFKDNWYEEHHDEVPIDIESNGSSDEPDTLDGAAASIDVSCLPSKDKWNFDTGKKKGKKKKIFAYELLYYVDWATTASENVAVKIDSFYWPCCDQPEDLQEGVVVEESTRKENRSILLDVHLPVPKAQ